MLLAVIFQFEEIRVLQEDGNRLRIALQPAGGDEDRRRDALVDQRRDNALIGLAHAGIEGQRNARVVRNVGTSDVQVRLYQLGTCRDRRTGGCGGGRFHGKSR